jgi:hypothetical protein
MVGTLTTWQWIVSDDAAQLRAAVAPGMPVGSLAKLRGRWTADQVTVAAELAGARHRAAAKFPQRASGIVTDREGLEMATSAAVGGHKANRFAEVLGSGAQTVDACCGIGGDAMGLADAGLTVHAIDLDERRAWMAGVNAGCRWTQADIREVAIDAPGLHIDPSRRGGGRRTLDAGAFEPPLPDVLALLDRVEMGAIKLNPGVDGGSLPPGELEIISEHGRLTQAVLWTGRAAPEGSPTRRATMIGPGGEVRTLTGDPDRPYNANPVGTWLHTFDPTVERADLVHMLLDETGLDVVHPGAGLLTGDEACDSPWVRAFRVVEDMPWNIKGLRARLRELDAGIVTVKTRAQMVDPDRLARDLRGKGPRDLVVFALKLGEKPHAIIAEPAERHAATP